MRLAVLTVSLTVFAQGPAGDSSDWKETLSWALGLPVSLAAVGGTLYALPKARRENRKLDLEIIEKERALGLARESNNPAEVARIAIEPILENRRAADLILRFVLLSLLLQAWGLVGNLLGSAVEGAQFGLERAVSRDASVWAIVGYLVVAVLASSPAIVRSLLFVGIGWPLLLDSAKLLKFDLPAFLYTDATRRVLVGVAVLASLMNNVLGAGLSLFLF